MTETAEKARLAQLEPLGDATEFAGRIHGLITFSPLFENFNLAEIRELSRFMRIYRAEPGAEIIRDGEPRFASCIAAESCLVAALSRESLARIILEQPTLGAKVLMELVLMLSQRLRQTSTKLVAFMDRERS